MEKNSEQNYNSVVNGCKVCQILPFNKYVSQKFYLTLQT